MKAGISEKFANALQFLSTFFVSVFLCFYNGWKLTLVLLAIAPVLFICAVLFTKLGEHMTSQELKSYAKVTNKR